MISNARIVNRFAIRPYRWRKDQGSVDEANQVKRSLETAVCNSERLSASNPIASSVRQTGLWDDLNASD
jgi:hypothetical protein